MVMKFKKKYTIDELRDIFIASGCELLQDYYETVIVPVKYRCNCGNVSKISISSFKNGNRCKQCGYKKINKKKKLSLEVVRTKFEEAGYEMTTDEYIDNKTPIPCICDKGHQMLISYSNFRKGSRCKKCFSIKNSGIGNHRYNPDRQAVKDNAKFRKACRVMVNRTLEYVRKEKKEKSKELLGYTSDQLKHHIFNHSNFSEIEDKWVIDHIFPIKAFIDYGISDIKAINALDNLQPLEEQENLIKNAKYDEVAFEKYLAERNIQWS